MSQQLDFAESASGCEEGEIKDDFEFIISSDDELSVLSRIHNQYGDSSKKRNYNEYTFDDTLPNDFACKKYIYENASRKCDMNCFTKRKRKKKRHRSTPKYKKLRENETSYSDNSSNCKNQLSDSNDTWYHSEKQMRYRDRKRLRFAILRQNCEDKKTLRERLHINSENKIMSEEVPDVSSNDIVKEENDEDSCEERELRLIALKSAILKKHFERKKRNEEIPYSPTDFDREKSFSNYDGTDLDDIPSEIDSCARESPLALEDVSMDMSENQDVLRKCLVENKIVDMEISVSDSESVQLNEVIDDESVQEIKPTNIYVSPAYFALHCSSQLNFELSSQNHFPITSIPPPPLPPLPAPLLDSLPMPLLSPAKTQSVEFEKGEKEESTLEEEQALRALLLSKYKSNAKTKSSHLSVAQNGKSELINSMEDSQNPSEYILKRALMRLRSATSNNLNDTHNSKLIDHFKCENENTQNIKTQNDFSVDKEELHKNIPSSSLIVHNMTDKAKTKNSVEFNRIHNNQLNIPQSSQNMPAALISNASATSTHLSAKIVPKISKSTVVSSKSLVIPERVQKTTKSNVTSTVTKVTNSFNKKLINTHEKKIRTTYVNSHKIVKPNKVINRKPQAVFINEKFNGNLQKLSSTSSNILAAENRLITSLDVASLQVKEMIIQVDQSESEDISDSEKTQDSSHYNSLLKGINQSNILCTKKSRATIDCCDAPNVSTKNPSTGNAVNKSFEENIDEFLNKIRTNKASNSSHTEKVPEVNHQNSSPLIPIEVEKQEVINSTSTLPRDVNTETNDAGVLQDLKSCPKLCAPSRTIDLRQTPKADSQNTLQINRKKQETKLQTYEDYISKMSANIITKLNQSIQLVEMAKKIKTSKVRYESYLRRLQMEMNLVKKKHKEEQENMNKVYPAICKTTELLTKLRDKHCHLNKTTLMYGKTLKGENYRIVGDQSENIARKFKMLATEIKHVNAIKYNTLSRFSHKTPIKKTDKGHGSEKIENKTNIQNESALKTNKEQQIEPCKSVTEAKDKEEDKDTEILVENSSLRPTVVTSELVEENIARGCIKMGTIQGNDQLDNYISPLSIPANVQKRQIDPNGVICPYDLLGHCVDKDCKFNHLHST